MQMDVTNDVLLGLTKRIPFKWRVGNKTSNKYQCLAYIDSRDAQRLLDEVVGPGNWQDDYVVVDGNLFCRVGIKISDSDGSSQWVWKMDVGTESNTEREKGNSSDSFKRACVKWGIGRFLYDEEIQMVDVVEKSNKFYPADNKGNIIWGGDDLTDYINARIKKKPGYASKLTPPPQEKPAVVSTPAPQPEKNVEVKSDKPRYTKTETDVPYSNDYKWSPDVINKVKKFEKNGKTGGDALKEYIPVYNASFGTTFSKVSDFSTDAALNGLLDFIENIPPAEVL